MFKITPKAGQKYLVKADLPDTSLHAGDIIRVTDFMPDGRVVCIAESPGAAAILDLEVWTNENIGILKPQMLGA